MCINEIVTLTTNFGNPNNKTKKLKKSHKNNNVYTSVDKRAL